jgi:hypothetical protein
MLTGSWSGGRVAGVDDVDVVEGPVVVTQPENTKVKRTAVIRVKTVVLFKMLFLQSWLRPPLPL